MTQTRNGIRADGGAAAAAAQHGGGEREGKGRGLGGSESSVWLAKRSWKKQHRYGHGVKRIDLAYGHGVDESGGPERH